MKNIKNHIRLTQTAKKHNITLKHKLSKTPLPFVTKLSQVLPKLCCINIANKSDKNTDVQTSFVHENKSRCY